MILIKPQNPTQQDNLTVKNTTSEIEEPYFKKNNSTKISGRRRGRGRDRVRVRGR